MKVFLFRNLRYRKIVYSVVKEKLDYLSPAFLFVIVANMIAQHDIQIRNGVLPIRYEAVREGLNKVTIFAQDHSASMHIPRIGAGLAGGKREIIEAIIKHELTAKNIVVTVYDLL